MAVWHSPQDGWRTPRRVRRWLAQQGFATLADDQAAESLDVLVVISALPDPEPMLDDAHWSRLRPGGLLVELASPRRRRAMELVRPWVYTPRLRRAMACRVRAWLERGAFAPEQWITVEPADVVVTIVRRAVGGGWAER